jgi:putative transposase
MHLRCILRSNDKWNILFICGLGGILSVGAGFHARPYVGETTVMDNLPQREQLRLKDYDYSQKGHYFVTICTYGRQNLLCTIAYPNTQFTDIGLQVENSILNIPSIFTGVYVDQYIIMPNHLHMIIVITETGGRGNPPLQDIIGRFKSFTTYEFNKINKTKGKLLWQRNFHDHIIRNEHVLQKIRQYITDNPAKWHEDNYFN